MSGFHIGPSPFHVWGWPWRGLGENYLIGDCASQVFYDGQSWLLDVSAPAVSLTEDEATEETANGWTWQNYAHISGGYIYGHNLQSAEDKKNAFIYVDADGNPHLVRLSLSFDENDVTVSAQIVRFGHFGIGEQSIFFKHDTVACEDISLPSEDWTRKWSISDVWTNGSEALITIGRRAAYSTYAVLYPSSVLKISMGGAGTSMTIDATELWGETTINVFDWKQHPDDPPYVDERESWTGTRYVYYKSDGSPTMLRVYSYLLTEPSGEEFYSHQARIEAIHDWDAPALVYYDWESYVYLCVEGSGAPCDEEHIGFTWSDSTVSGFLSDIGVWVSAVGGFESTPGWIATDTDWSIGSLFRVGLIGEDVFPYGVTNFPMWSFTHSGTSDTCDTRLVLAATGIIGFRADFSGGGTDQFSDFITPLGMLPPPAYHTGLVYWAWNRKTDENTFGTVPICYV